MDPEKPSCPEHGARFVGARRGSNGIGKWYSCSYGDFERFISNQFRDFGEVIAMDVWEKMAKGFEELGKIIAEGGDDMKDRARKELDELGAVIAEEKKKK